MADPPIDCKVITITQMRLGNSISVDLASTVDVAKVKLAFRSPVGLQNTKFSQKQFLKHNSSTPLIIKLIPDSSVLDYKMRSISFLVAAVSYAGLAVSGPCPFQSIHGAAIAGNLHPHDAVIVNKMARDPTYIPALDPEVASLLKRTAAPGPEAEAAALHFVELDAEEKRALLSSPLNSGLPSIGGGLRK